MDELFRFMTVRGPESADAVNTVPLAGASGTTPFQDKLREYRGEQNAFENMAELARQFEASSEFADPIESLSYGAALMRFQKRLKEILADGDDSPQALAAMLAKAVTDEFGMEPGDLSGSGGFALDMNRVHDSLVALFLAPATGAPPPAPEQAADWNGETASPLGTPPLARAVPMEPLAAFARMLNLIVLMRRYDPAVQSPAGVVEALQRPLLLPPTIFPIFPGQWIRPAGVADLRVVRQHLARYEAGEISDIRNLLAGESRARTEKHTVTVENTITTEREKTTETTKELKTAERFNLKQEVENTLKEDTQVKAGVSISAKFGKTVQLDANLDVAYGTSRQNAARTASEYAKEVTKRSASKVTERIRTQEISKTVETFVDGETHTFDNSAGTSHTRGVYQWVNKIYSAQVFNYGKRLLFDISVPEPGAFLLSGSAKAVREAAPQAPPELTLDGKKGPRLRPADLSPLSNNPRYYQIFVARYGVQGVEAPPPDRLVVSEALSASDTSENDKSNLLIEALDSLKIPEGYAAETIRVNGTYTQKNDEGGTQVVEALDSVIAVFNGPVAYYFNQGRTGVDRQLPLADSSFKNNTVALAGVTNAPEVDQMALSLSTWNVQDVALSVEVVCRRTASALEKWQLRTYSAILETYNRLLSYYKDRLAGMSVMGTAGGSPAPIGGHPDMNRAIERRELKKGAIGLVLGRNLSDERLGAIVRTPPTGQTRNFPRLDLRQAARQGAMVRFFEQAFEWEEMTYFLYPYFWGRLSTWYDRALMQHDDPMFLEFLKAGMARVVIPVRPGFENDVFYYLMTGQTWAGGDLPDVTDTDYLPITQEIKEVTGAPGEEKPEGESWELVVPTKLVKLRDDGKLPAWKQDPPGNWRRWVEDPANSV